MWFQRKPVTYFQECFFGVQMQNRINEI